VGACLNQEIAIFHVDLWMFAAAFSLTFDLLNSCLKGIKLFAVLFR